MEKSSPKTDITWDLSPLFAAVDSEAIYDRKILMMEKSREFEKKYKTKINIPNPSAEFILAMLKEHEDFLLDYIELVQYSRLKFAANMTDSSIQQLFNEIQDLSTTIGKNLTFFVLEMGKLLLNHPELIGNSVLGNYKHFLEKLAREQPYFLTEVEEQIILEKDQYGVNAWSTLQGAWLNTRKFEVEVEGVKKILSYGDANGLLSHPDRSTRTSANKSIYSKLGEDQEIFSTALRNVCGNWIKNYKRRNYNSPLDHSLIVNDTEYDTIVNLMTTVQKNAGVYQRYLKIKAKLMNLPKLGCEDVAAPLPNSHDSVYSYERAKTLILTAFKNFDTEFASYAELMFTENRIDVTPRFGKRNGAFCSGWGKGKSAFVLTNFTEDLGSTYTLGHELGHAAHSHFMFRKQTPLNTSISSCVAECASIFGELLITDLLLAEAKSDEEKVVLLSHILDEAGMGAFQVNARFWFERQLYKAVEHGTNLDGETISKLWTTARDNVYGDAVDFFDEMRWEWTMKPHYYIPNFRYYNYPYVFAQLFVYSLYKLYKKDPVDFVPKFKSLLEAGSSISSAEASKIMGLDISSPEFWKLGIDLYGEFTSRLESLL